MHEVCSAMASPFLRRSPVRRASVCLTCGDKGAIDLLIYCRRCQDSAVHHYCLDNFSPDDDNIKWWCWDCAPGECIAGPSRKSERICTKQLKVQNTQKCWKERLNQNKSRVWNGNGSYETDRLASEDDLGIAGVEVQSGHDKPEEETLRPEIPSHSDDCEESSRIDEPTVAIERTFPPEEESSLMLVEVTQKIDDASEEKQILVLNDSIKSQEEHIILNIHVPHLAACTTTNTVCSQNPSEPDRCFSAEPVTNPIWRGWFSIQEESKTCLEILAHLSDKACQQASAAATAIPTMLDIEVLDKHVVWPKSFQVLPPTAASIALYFFPARDRVERDFDSLLEEVIERDLALKATVNGAALLIFSSCELPLRHWRYCGKYYLWGVFRKKQQTRSLSDIGMLQ